MMRYALVVPVLLFLLANTVVADQELHCDVAVQPNPSCSNTSSIDSKYTTICRQITIDCDAKSDSDCRSQTVAYADEDAVTLRFLITTPTSIATGVVVFGAGGGGTVYYEVAYPDAVEDLLEPLLAEGYIVIQRRWSSSWMAGDGGLRSLSRRGARMYEWLAASDGSTAPDYDDFPRLDNITFLASANAGGSAEICYALAFHCQEGTLDGAVPSSGPSVSDLQRGCWGDDLDAFDPVWFNDTECKRDDSPAQDDVKTFIGSGYCFDKDGDGTRYEDCSRVTPGCSTCCVPDPPCTGGPFEAYDGVYNAEGEDFLDNAYDPPANCDPNANNGDDALRCPCGDTDLTDASDTYDAQAAQLCYDSLMCDDFATDEDPDYDYGTTEVAFVYGDEDCDEFVPLGLLFATTIDQNSGDDASISFVDGGDHDLPETGGAGRILEALRHVGNTCAGDANLDGVVDGCGVGLGDTADVTRIDDNLSCSVGTGDLECDASDVDGDGDVDGDDKKCAEDNDGLCVATCPTPTGGCS